MIILGLIWKLKKKSVNEIWQVLGKIVLGSLIVAILVVILSFVYVDYFSFTSKHLRGGKVNEFLDRESGQDSLAASALQEEDKRRTTSSSEVRQEKKAVLASKWGHLRRDTN